MDELPPRARALLDVARDTDEPSDADRERIDRRFRGLLIGFGLPALPPLTSRAAAQGTGASAGAAGAGVGFSGGLSLAAAVAAAVAVGAGALWSLSGTSERSAARQASVMAPVTVVAPSLVAAPPQEPFTSTAVAVQVARREPAAVPKARLKRAVPGSARSVPRGDLQREVQLVGEANRALSSQRYAQALEVLERHAAEFPAGYLREERRALRVLALCSAGRLDEGRREKRRVLARAPGGVLARRVSDACLVAAEPTTP